MSLKPGVVSLTVEFAKDLKDKDWFGKQDPYCVLRVGTQTFKTNTAQDGGKNPVWNETFQFNVIHENDAEIKLMDEDHGRDDDFIGLATLNFTRARQHGTDRAQVPVMIGKGRRQHGFVSVAINWQSL